MNDIAIYLSDGEYAAALAEGLCSQGAGGVVIAADAGEASKCRVVICEREDMALFGQKAVAAEFIPISRMLYRIEEKLSEIYGKSGVLKGRCRRIAPDKCKVTAFVAPACGTQAEKSAKMLGRVLAKLYGKKTIYVSFAPFYGEAAVPAAPPAPEGRVATFIHSAAAQAAPTTRAAALLRPGAPHAAPAPPAADAPGLRQILFRTLDADFSRSLAASGAYPKDSYGLFMLPGFNGINPLLLESPDVIYAFFSGLSEKWGFERIVTAFAPEWQSFAAACAMCENCIVIKNRGAEAAAAGTVSYLEGFGLSPRVFEAAKEVFDEDAADIGSALGLEVMNIAEKLETGFE